jgi:hypothetical protein
LNEKLLKEYFTDNGAPNSSMLPHSSPCYQLNSNSWDEMRTGLWKMAWMSEVSQGGSIYDDTGQDTHIFLVVTMWTAAAAHAAGLTPVIVIVAGRIDLLIGSAPGMAAGEVARVVLVICGRDECNLEDKNMVSNLSCLDFVPLEFIFSTSPICIMCPIFCCCQFCHRLAIEKFENCQMV